MRNANKKKRPTLEFIEMDALNMSFENDSFNVIIDKGTLDAMMPDDAEFTLEKINKYFAEIQRVMATGGRYICVSLLQEHILQKISEYFPLNNWFLRVIRCHCIEKKATDSGENSLPVFLIVCTKFNNLPTKVLYNGDNIRSLIKIGFRGGFKCGW